MRMTAAERLPYFTDYLEVEDPAIAADAFAEIGRARSRPSRRRAAH